MNSQFLFEKLHSSEEYKDFIKEKPDAFLCSGFFIIDLENKEKSSEDKYNLDFYIPSEKKVFSFQLDNKIKLSPVERPDEKAPEKVPMNDNFDFDKIKELITREMEFKRINNKIQKMLFSLQGKDGKDFLLGTIFISGFGMVKVTIDLKEKRITDFEKKSFFDMLNIVRK